MAKRRLIDIDTGEIVQARAERFTKHMTEVWRVANNKGLFTTAEQIMLHQLAAYLKLNTNAIVTTHGDYMSIEGMASVLGVDRSHVRKVIKKLMGKNAIGRWSSNNCDIYYMSPYVYQCGEIQPLLFRMFDDEYEERRKRDMVKRFIANKKMTSLIQANAT